MSLEQRVIDMIKHHEGVRVKPYQCPALIWTVGVGHVIDQSHIRVPLAERKALLIPDGWDRTLSMGEVDEILAKDLVSFENGYADYVLTALLLAALVRSPALLSM